MEWVILIVILGVCYYYYLKSKLQRKAIEEVENFPYKVNDKFKTTIKEINEAITRQANSTIDFGNLSKELMKGYKNDLEEVQNLEKNFFYIVEKYKHSDLKQKATIYWDFWEYLSQMESGYLQSKYGLSDYDLPKDAYNEKHMRFKALTERVKAY